MAVSVYPGYYDTGLKKGQLRTRQVTLSAKPQLALDLNNQRVSASIINTSLHTVFIGPKGECDTSNGFPLPTGMAINFMTNVEVYAVTANAGDIIGVIEEYIK